MVGESVANSLYETHSFLHSGGLGATPTAKRPDIIRIAKQLGTKQLESNWRSNWGQENSYQFIATVDAKHR